MNAFYPTPQQLKHNKGLSLFMQTPWSCIYQKYLHKKTSLTESFQHVLSFHFKIPPCFKNVPTFHLFEIIHVTKILGLLQNGGSQKSGYLIFPTIWLHFSF